MKEEEDPMAALNRGFYLSALLSLGGMFVACYWLLRTPETGGAQVIDLMEALKASLDAAGGGTSGNGLAKLSKAELYERAKQALPLGVASSFQSYDPYPLFMTDARVPHSNVIGEPNRGWGVAVTTLAHERNSLGASGMASAAGTAPPPAGSSGPSRFARDAIPPRPQFPITHGRP